MLYRRSFWSALCFLTVAASPARAQVDARVWVENDRDYFNRGDYLDVNFVVSDDAYVAVIHLDTDGSIEFVYPQTPWDNEYVRGGRIQRIASRGRSSGWGVRGREGIGYFYIVASPTPLDFSYFRGRPGNPWDWGYAGRTVHGDPFLAMDQLTRLLVGQWGYSPYVYDYYSYYVGGRYRYPAYACSDQYYDSGWGWNSSYGSCAQLDTFLRDRPYYYDTGRYRGDRRTYLRDYDRLDPRYGFKEDPERPSDRRAVPRDSDRRGAASPADDRWAAPRRDAVEPEDRGGSFDRSSSGSARGVTGSTDRSAAPSQGVRARPRPDDEPDRRAAEPDAPSSSREPARGRP